MKRKQAPEIQMIAIPEDVFYWNAYQILRNSRSVGFGVGGIPIQAIMVFADHAGIECPVNRNRFLRMMTALDYAEREFEHARNS